MENRAVFISDLHLGTHACQSKKLLSFLKELKTKKLILVGDILDLWKLKNSWSWSKQHNEVVREILKISKHTEVVYVIGNHDEMLRGLLSGPTMFGNISITNKYEYASKDNGRFLVIHGDQFDKFLTSHPWIGAIGSWAYDVLLGLNTILTKIQQLLKLKHWSLSQYLKQKAKQATGVIERFETTLVSYAKQQGYSGVICGHIHKAALDLDKGYINTGDWVESCTAIIETHSGKFELRSY